MDTKATVRKWLKRCESPIERRFAEALLRRDDCGIRLGWDGGYLDLPRKAQRDLLVVSLQVPWKQYRLDVGITLARGDAMAGVVVEVDGHNFHERTKEQARRDRSRDRAFTAAGFDFLRFTGSEAHRDADACADEVLSLLRSRLGGRG